VLDNTYQVIEPPKEMEGFYDRRLGKSEKGVYSAYNCGDDMFQIWFLDESRGHTEWVFKKDINFKRVPWRPCAFGWGSWSIEQYDQYEAQELEENSEWDPDDKDVISIEQWVGTQGSNEYDFLGFHPYKEIAILFSTTSNVVIACHFNTSKVRSLGHIYLGSHQIDLSFPYTPCWMGPLPGSLEHLISGETQS
jgi:hypothetical protein